MAQNKIIKPRTIEVSIVCDEFNVADVLRDFANYIEENDLDFSGNPQFEGDDYEGEIKLVYLNRKGQHYNKKRIYFSKQRNI